VRSALSRIAKEVLLQSYLCNPLGKVLKINSRLYMERVNINTFSLCKSPYKASQQCDGSDDELPPATLIGLLRCRRKQFSSELVELRSLYQKQLVNSFDAVMKLYFFHATRSFCDISLTHLEQVANR